MSQTQVSSTAGLVIGGGVIGLALAWEWARRGHSVCVLEARGIGRAASWAGAGILPAAPRRGNVDPYEMLRSLSHQLHPEWSSQLRQQTGIDTGFSRCGGLYLARSRGEAATLAAQQSWWETHGIDHQRWSPEELAQREPALQPLDRDDLLAAWFLPDECQIRNPRYLKALAAGCRQLGVRLIEHAPVEDFEWSIESSGGVRRVTAVVTPQGRFAGEHICICAGAWGQTLLAQLGVTSGILPVRGQMVLYQCDQPPLRSVVNEGHRYLVPRADGRLLAGSVEEEVGFVVETTDQGVDAIRGWAESVLPLLRDCPIERTWAGLRPGSFDGLPYLGLLPGFDNLFAAVGHFRSGLHLSCGTAVVMADLMLGKPVAIDLHPFRVGRG